MRVTANMSALARSRWNEYLPRFLFGGVVTAFAGVMAKEFGPSFGGLFLAFPAIFPAGATLIERHEREKKRETGGHGRIRGRKAAGLDAAGASIGALGLLSFAVVVWKLVVLAPLWEVLSSATLAWFMISILAWKLWRAVRRTTLIRGSASR